MTKSEIIKAAKELANALCYVSPICNGLHDPVKRQEWNGVIHALIALVPKDGEVVVPEEPTDNMLLAGELAGSIVPSALIHYKAMLKAAKEGK